MKQSKNEALLIEALENAAQGRNDGRKSRVIIAIAISALASCLIPMTYTLGWLASVLVVQIVDNRVFNTIAHARKPDMSTYQAKLLATASVGISTIVFASMGLALWQLGGTSGKLFAVLLFNGSLVHASTFLSQARFLYWASVTPFIAALLGLLGFAYFGDHTMQLSDLISVSGGLALFLVASHKAHHWIQSILEEQKAAQLATIREKEKAEQASAHLRAVNHAIDCHAMVTRTTPDGLILSVNDAFCEKTQYTQEELVGENHRILDTGYHSAQTFQEMETFIMAGKVWSGQIQNKAKDGSLYWGDVTISPIKNKNGKITECITIRRDVTDLLEAREQAERANQAKSEFLAMMSHELRTPMNAVLGMASLLKATDLNHLQREYITALSDGGEMLMTVLNDILDLSKIEAGKMEVETIDVDVRHAVRRLERLWAPNAEDKGLKFICEISDDVPSVIRGDITRIRQIIYNLLSNAVKFTEEGEVRLSITAKPVGQHKTQICFAVKDTGIGISETAQSRLFTSFEQADTSVTRKFGGTGLGLAISKKLAQLMGGDITLCSECGSGTCFTFLLEATTVTQESLKESIEKGPVHALPKARKDRKQLRILAAEDNPLNQRVLNAFLNPFNHEIIMVEDGVEALEQLSAQPFDLVLMDVQMPRKDGMTTTRELRASGGPNANIPVIAMTANAMSEDRQKCMDAGMTDYVTKPIDPRLLVSAIARASTHEKELAKISDKKFNSLS